MIASLHGRLELLGSDWAIINVNGIGFQVYMPTSTLNTVGSVGQEVHLHTDLHVREDDITLYGFTTSEELQLFQTLMCVSGVGPKLAMSVLSAMSVEQASIAIATGSTEMLTMVPGIGKKIAGRLILELKDKIGASLTTTPSSHIVQENTDVLDALTSLGYSVAEANRAVATIPQDKKLSLEEKIKLALQYLGGK
ncbi:MAG: Holliday junction branch migration protein RuvA [Dehalococcoidales bacterium]|nr:Holliday junction branch migration protein RuvA [Dehalococcoidales bacterium]